MARRYKYSHRHTFDTTANMGIIQPSFWKYVTPLDTWGGLQLTVGRLAPMNKPVFGDIYFDTFFFYVALKDIWNKAEGFPDEFRDVIGEKDTSYTWPTYTHSQNKTTGTHDVPIALGLGAKDTAGASYTVSALPIMAYYHIWNKMFRNDQFQAEEDLTAPSGTLYKAYFKGQGYMQLLQNDIEQGAAVTIDTSGATLDIQDVKDAMRADKYKRLKERYGEEYEDILRLHGVNPGSAQSEGVQLVAKGSAQIGVSEVLATATSASENTGEYVGQGILINRTNIPQRLYLDYGILMGVSVMRPRLVVKNRIPYEWDIQSFDDMYHKFFVGNQMRNVKYQEIFSGLNTNRDSVFAYHDKYEHLRRTADVVAGDYSLVDTYDDQILGFEHGTWAGSAPDTHGNLVKVRPGTFDYLFQDSTQPHIYLHHVNHVGVKSIVPRRG